MNLGENSRSALKAHSRSPSAFTKGQSTKTGPVETFIHDDSIYSTFLYMSHLSSKLPTQAMSISKSVTGFKKEVLNEA